MSTITKEQLTRIIDSAEFIITALSGDDEVINAEYEINHSAAWDKLINEASPEVVRELARIALASLEAEAAGFIVRHKGTGKFGSWLRQKADWFKSDEYEVLKAYTDPPAPVSVPDEMEPTAEAIKRVLPTSNPDEYAACIGADMWNACRAAMLERQSVDHVVQASPTGTKTAPALDSLPKNDDSPTSNYPVIPDGLSAVCAETYQVVGVMAEALGVFDSAEVQKVLDNLSQQKLVHSDVLPFSLPAVPPAPVVPGVATIESTYPDVQTSWQDAKMYAEGWNACRAAMLQGAEPDRDSTCK